MRHNQNTRRARGHSNNGMDRSGGHRYNSGSGKQGGKRVNLRVQSFDSNGPDVRIRGTAHQINEKYVTLARDATSAGDHVLAESYLQHAEHYQRFINEITEEANLYNKQHKPQQQPEQQPQQQPAQQPAQQPQQKTVQPPQRQPDGSDVATNPEVDKLNDLDQGFLVGSRNVSQPDGAKTSQPSSDKKEESLEKPQNLRNRASHHSTTQNKSEAS